MHYRNGRPAQNGDKVIQLDFNGKPLAIGVLHSAVPGNDFCNGRIAPIQPTDQGACLADCLHLDDLEDLLRHHGLDRRR